MQLFRQVPRLQAARQPLPESGLRHGKNRCKTTNKTNGVACGDGKTCQDGACEKDTRTVGISLESFNQYHTHCYVTVEAAGFAPGTYPGSAGYEVFTVEVGGDGTGSWTSKSIRLIWQSGDTVEAMVDGVSSGKVPVTC
jgi:hypothetical protein